MTRKPFHHESEAVRRQTLIDATLDCIADYGLTGTTVRQIAERAGVTGGLIRHYFTSKDMLMHAAYLDLMGRMTRSATQAAESAGDPVSRLRAYILASFSDVVMDKRLMSLWATFIGQIHIDPALTAIHREGYLQFRDALEKLIAEFCGHHGLSTDRADIRRKSIAINAIIDGLWLEGCMAADLFAPGELAEVAILSCQRVLGHDLDMTNQDNKNGSSS